MNQQSFQEEITQLHANICSGLADPIRILILYTLSESPFNVSDLSKKLNLPQPTTSRHLKQLRERGLVSTERDGLYIYYHLADPRVIEALNLLRKVLNDRLTHRAKLVEN